MSKFKLIFIISLIASCAGAQSSSNNFYKPNIDKQLAVNSLEKSEPSLEKSESKPVSSSSSVPLSSSPKPKKNQVQIINSFSGNASWYGPGFHGKKTASGEVFDENKLTAAHRSLPLGTFVRITNVANGKNVIAKINDRGPFVGNRVLDGSKQVAKELDFIDLGIAEVKVDVLGIQKSSATVANKTYAQKASTQPAPSVNSSSYSPEKYLVQLGAFSMQQNAENFKLSLKKEFNELDIKAVQKNNLYKVLVGPYPSRNLAEDVKGYLTKKGYKGFITRI